MKQGPILVDTGPIVALISRRDRHHLWAQRQFSQFNGPFLTCESVLSEACFLLAATVRGPQLVMELVEQGLIQVGFDLNLQKEAVAALIRRYDNVPMLLADACLVSMSELFPRAVLLTFDSDFEIYRKNRSELITFLRPESS